MSTSRVAACLLLLTLVPPSADPARGGGGCPEALLGSLDTLPWNGNVQPVNSGNEFDPSAYCTGGGNRTDYVVCFKPEQSCSVSTEMTFTATSTNYCMGVVQGDCLSHTLVNQVSGIGTSTTVASPAIALTGGVEYCAFFEADQNVTLPLVLQAEGATDCGSLPVTLLSFQVGD